MSRLVFRDLTGFFLEFLSAVNGISGSDLLRLEDIQSSWLFLVHSLNHHLLNVTVDNFTDFLRGGNTE